MRFLLTLFAILWAAVATAQQLPTPQFRAPADNDNSPRAATTGWVRGALPGMMVQPGAVPRGLQEKLTDFRTLDDYIQPADNGDFAPAIERAAAAGVKALGLVDGRVYTLKRAVNLPNGTMSIRGLGPKSAEIRLLGAADTWFNVGNGSTMSYNFFLDNILFTKELASSAGAIVKATNLYLWGFSNIRVFGEDKPWRVIDCTSCGELTSRDVKVENVRAQAVYVTCGTAPPGNPGGQCFDFILDNWYTYGTNSAATTDALDAFRFEDNFQAVRIFNPTTGKHRGYAYNFKGTVPNRGNNALNFVVNPNVESSFVPSGVASFGAVASSQIGGSVSWVTGTGGTAGANFPAIYLSPNAQNITVRGMQLGMAKPGALGIQDDGVANHVQDVEFVGYDTDADTALVLGSTAAKGLYRRLKVSQLRRVIYDNSPDTAGHSIRDVSYSGISGTPLTGLVGSTSGNKDIGGILNLDAGAPSIAAAATLALPDKGETFRVNSAGTINGIAPTYLGRRVTLLLEASGTTLNDLQSASGTGAFYLSPGAFTTNSGRWRVVIEWRGDYWWEVSRAP